jgi:maleate cis-trans isomerase
MAGYLGAHGFETILVEGWDIGFKELQNVAPSAIYRFASGVLARAKKRAEGCDALYLPCPQWQAAQIVDVLEKDGDTPVIAYTHATFFAAFKALGLRDPIHGHGRLLASLADTAR